MTVAALLAAMAACFTGIPQAAEAQNVLAYHNTPDHSGLFTVPGLTVAAAANTHLDTAFHATISGNVYAQPLYWQQGAGKPPLLIVATQSNLVYALNANTGVTVWKTQLAPAVQGGLPCGYIFPEGVSGTPVIDPATGRLYLDASTIQGGSLPRHMIYALSLASGKVVSGWPINVDKQMAARKAPFTSELQGERSALQFFKGKLYISYGGRAGDCGDSKTGAIYRGVVVEVTPSAAPKITGDWETRAARGGIWAQGGVASDGTSLFATTGNTSGADSWGDGEAIVRLGPGLAHSGAARDNFAPADWQGLDNADLDLGGTAAIPIDILSGSKTLPRLLGLGKDGRAYLLNRDNLGGIGHALKNVLVSNSQIKTGPAAFETVLGTFVAFTGVEGIQASCSGTDITMLKITGDATTPITIAWCVPFSGGGAPIITTSNGAANAIVWATGAEGDNQLHGFDALTGKTVFSGTGTTMTGLHHFSTLIAANHHLYVAGDSNIYAFTF
jgi:outer membrane protein assembly factor BamB